jgi:hypothetical protein
VLKHSWNSDLDWSVTFTTRQIWSQAWNPCHPASGLSLHWLS